jgi:acyl dehydratase
VKVGDTARRSKLISTAEVEILELRDDKPLSTLRTTIVNQDGTIVLDGTAHVWTEQI